MDLSKTIEELENEFWGEPEFKSSLVLNCHRLRKVPLSLLTSENLRMLIGQEIALVYLLPLALDKLELNLLESGDMYDGDLLNAVASVSNHFLCKEPELAIRIYQLTTSIEQAIETLSQSMAKLKERNFN
jgi:hypothetical protein